MLRAKEGRTKEEEERSMVASRREMRAVLMSRAKSARNKERKGDYRE